MSVAVIIAGIALALVVVSLFIPRVEQPQSVALDTTALETTQPAPRLEVMLSLEFGILHRSQAW